MSATRKPMTAPSTGVRRLVESLPGTPLPAELGADAAAADARDFRRQVLECQAEITRLETALNGLDAERKDFKRDLRAALDRRDRLIREEAAGLPLFGEPAGS